MILTGMVLAVALILVDKVLAAGGSKFRTPVMPVAVGIYLPVGTSVPIFVGGLAAFAAEHYYSHREARADNAPAWRATAESGLRRGVLFASGLIAGEAIVATLIPILVVIGLVHLK